MELSEKVKRGLETCVNYNLYECAICPYGDMTAMDCAITLKVDALAYVRELEARVAEHEKPLKPMTLEEVDEHVRSNDANPLWIEDKTGYPSDEWILAATVWQMCKIMRNRRHGMCRLFFLAIGESL